MLCQETKNSFNTVLLPPLSMKSGLILRFDAAVRLICLEMEQVFCEDMSYHPRQHKELALVFFSTFEPIKLTPNAFTQRNGVPMFYYTAGSINLPSLYICLARNVLGRMPLMPCFMTGNRTPTLQHSFGNSCRF